MLGARQPRDLERDDLLTINATDSLSTSACSSAITLFAGHPSTFGHRGVSFVDLVEQTDDHERHGGRIEPPPRRELHHNYRLNLADCGGEICGLPVFSLGAFEVSRPSCLSPGR